MDKRTTGIIATVAATLLCGCPGLGICLFGAITAAGAGTFNDEYLSPTVGFVLLCLSLIFIAIPVVVGVLMLRKQPGEGDEVPPAPAAPAAPVVPAAPATPETPAAPPETPAEPEEDEPLPPAS